MAFRSSRPEVFLRKGVLRIWSKLPIRKCDFNKVPKQLYWNHTSAWLLLNFFWLRTENILLKGKFVVDVLISIMIISYCTVKYAEKFSYTMIYIYIYIYKYHWYIYIYIIDIYIYISMIYIYIYQWYLYIYIYIYIIVYENFSAYFTVQ